jgi:hypothetical protein
MTVTIKEKDNGIRDSSGQPWKGPKLVPKDYKGEKIYEASVRCFLKRRLEP